jgi:hypothetical protein
MRPRARDCCAVRPSRGAHRVAGRAAEKQHADECFEDLPHSQAAELSRARCFVTWLKERFLACDLELFVCEDHDVVAVLLRESPRHASTSA